MVTKPNRRLPTARAATTAPPILNRPEPPKIWAYWSRPLSPQPVRSRWRWLTFFGLGWALIMGVALLLVGAVTLGLLYRSSLIMPGVSIQEHAMGRLSTTAAVALLQTKWQQQRIELEAAYTSQMVIPETLGINLDPEATVNLAHRQGRSLNSFLALVRDGKQIDIAPVIRFRPDLAEKNLQLLAPQFEVPALNARMRLVGDRVEAVPAAAGQKLDIRATLAQLSPNPAQVLQDRRFKLVLVTIEPELVDVSGPVAQANQLLSQPMTIRAYDPVEDEVVTWNIEPETWGGWLNLELQAGDPTQLSWYLNEDQAKTFLMDKQAEMLGPNRYVTIDKAITGIKSALTSQNWPVKLTVLHRERQHTVRVGETLSSIGYDYGIPYPWIEQVNPGLGDRLSAGQVIAIPSPDGLLPLPAVEHKRMVVSLSEQKMRVYENGAVKWEWPVSTGIASSPTAPGIFQVQNHEPNAYASNWNLWMPNFMGIYRPVPTSDFMNGFHGFPTRNGSNLLWTNDLGHPVTYGCILLSSQNAETLYDWAEAGVVVEVKK